MYTPLPITQELLLIGGGHTHALVLRMWGMNPVPGVRVTVVNPAPTAPYSGMLPGHIAGHYARDTLDIDLVRLARFAGARLICGRVIDIDTHTRRVTLRSGRQLGYNVASIDIGITSEMPDLKGFSEFGVPVKPLGRFARLWEDFRKQAATASFAPGAAVIGGGIAGVELAMAMSFALRQISPKGARVTLLDRAPILQNLPNKSRQVLRGHLMSAGITVLENVEVCALEANRIVLSDGNHVDAAFVTGAAGTRPQGWLAKTSLNLQDGYICVDETLRALNTPSVFAVGDCAHMTHAPRPKAGVFAVRQAPVLFANLRVAVSGYGKMRKFAPQKDYFKLVSLGGKTAFADKWGLRLSGPLVWRLKDRIDRKFMNQFEILAPMRAPEPVQIVAIGVREALGNAPLCGGCGAKVGGVALDQVLHQIEPLARPDILSGPGDDAAILKGPDGQFQVISTDHLRAFASDPAQMARIAAVHALGDIWAMGATPQSALASITLPRLSNDLQKEWLGEIMKAASAVFAAEGAAMVGGHTAQGAELSIGFTVTGLRKTAPIRKTGARVGDALILTKPIGTGVILAGDMALKARGRWVVDALASMQTPQGDSARILHSANALSDVTGFGLAGHLSEIARGSRVGIALDLDAVPLLDGALELARAGVRSSLYADNRALVPDLAVPNDARADLLFDPQTSGGLLAAVPAASVKQICCDLNALGVVARVIGRCTKASDGFRLL